MASQKTRALSLLSGGLDSMLAARVLLEQGIEVTGITFVTPFFSDAKGRKAASILGIPFLSVEITDRYLKMMKSPRFGFGSQMNPCIDCHTLMVRVTGEILDKEGYDLIATGEVLGERPMSQNKQSLMNVGKHSGYGELLIRPLSAKLLPPSKPEREGKVDREQLLDISGRSRKRQMALAKKFNIHEYPQPAGGCLLTDPMFSKRLKDLREHTPEPTVRQLQLLKLGRHFRYSPHDKIIIGRNEAENNALEKLRIPDDTVLDLEPLPGPLGLVVGKNEESAIQLAASLCVNFSKYRGEPHTVNVERNSEKRRIEASVISRDEFITYQIR